MLALDFNLAHEGNKAMTRAMLGVGGGPALRFAMHAGLIDAEER
jgi:hypothetical protein